MQDKNGTELGFQGQPAQNWPDDTVTKLHMLRTSAGTSYAAISTAQLSLGGDNLACCAAVMVHTSACRECSCSFRRSMMPACSPAFTLCTPHFPFERFPHVHLLSRLALAVSFLPVVSVML